MLKFEENLASRVSGALQPMLGVQVTVTAKNGLLATLYADDESTVLANPLTTDANGYFGFKAANGEYALTFAGAQIETATRKIELYDADDDPPLTLAQAAVPTASSRLGFQPAGDGARARTVENKLRDIYNVLDFGPLVADSVSAASANLETLNRAILDVSNAGGGVLNLPAGEFLFSPIRPGPVVADRCILLRRNVYLKGAGQAKTILKRNQASTLMTNAPEGAFDTGYGGGENNCGISDMTLDGNAAFSPLYPANISFWFGSDNVRINDVTFLNAPGLHGIDLNGCRFVMIERCRFSGHNKELSAVGGDPTYYPEAIQLGFETGGGTFAGLANRDVTIRDCWFGPSDTQGTVMAAIGHHSARLNVFTDNIAIQDCVIDSAVAHGIRVFCWRNVKIENVKFGSMPKGILLSSAKNILDSFNVASGVSQSGSDISIRNCYFEDVTGVNIDFDTGHVNTAAYSKWTNIEISYNTFFGKTVATGVPLSLKWISGLTLIGNQCRGSFSRTFYSRFCDSVKAVANQFEGTSLELVLVDESTETQFARTGLTHTWVFTDNVGRNAAFSGFSINGALTNGVFSRNVVSNVGTSAPERRSGFIFGGFASYISAEGNVVNKCAYGVEATASCSNITIGNNVVSDALNGPVRNLATGASSTNQSIGTGTATYNPPSLAAAASASTTVTVPGAALGDVAQATFSLDLQGISITAWVSAADTVTVRYRNDSGATVDLGSGTLKASVTRIA